MKNMKFVMILLLSFCFISKIQAKSIQGVVSVTSSPNLYWVPVSGATAYKITLKKINSDGSTGDTFGPYITSSPPYQISEVLPEAVYKVTIKAQGTNANKLNYYIQVTSDSSSENLYVTIQAQEFLPKVSDTDYEFEISDGHFFVDLAGSMSTEISISAAVKLPEGSQINSVKVYYKNVGAEPTMMLYRRGNLSGSSESVLNASLTLTGTGDQTVSTTSINTSRSVVDNDNYIYYIDIDNLTNTDLIQRVDIYYSN